MTALEVFASGRRIALSLSRSKAPPLPTANFARRHHRRMSRMTGTCRYMCTSVATTGSHRRFDDPSPFCQTHSNKEAHPEPSHLHSREYHASSAQRQSSDDFAIRAEQFGLASKEEVALAAEDPSTVFLDVRSPPEIENAPLTGRACVQIWCTMDDTSRLIKEAEQKIPDKDGEFRL